MESKINLFKDKPDYIKKITDDEIINVFGSVGSGKSTYAKQFINNNKYIVIGLDSVYNDNDPNTKNEYVLEVRELLLKKYKKLENNISLYYDDIIKYIKQKNKIGIIEGMNSTIEDISIFKGTILVKRTSRFKCYYRSAMRDFKNPVWRKGLNKWGLIKRFFTCFKRRFKLVYRHKNIEDIINKLELNICLSKYCQM